MYQIFVYVPEGSVEKLKQNLFDLGVGKFGEYSHCVWQTLGQGQFKPLANSSATIGDINKITQVKEYKLEFYCSSEINLEKVILVLKQTHPYETPAYGVIKLENF